MKLNTRQRTQEGVIRMKIWMQGAFAALAAALLCCATAHAQKQADLALSGFGTLTSSSSGFGTEQTPVNAEGGLFEWRYLVNPFVGAEFAYSFNPATQSYKPSATCGQSLSSSCGQPPLTVNGKANEIAINWIASIRKGNLRPFALGGLGMMITVPGNSPYSVNTVVRPVFIYGGGFDWSFTKHWGLRLQIRGNMSKAPNLSDLYDSTTEYKQIYEPVGGVFYRF
jgi:hypothetical protein